MRPLSVIRLGRVEYEDGLGLQRLFGRARQADQVPDTLLLLEHPPVLTLGRGAHRENITASPEQLAELGVEIFETDRGGDVTYHGPGQIVGYPIFKLSPDRQDVRKYVRNLEETIIQTLAPFGISAARIPKWPGVWLGEEGRDPRKIAAIGVHLSRWLTSHGFALNVNTLLSHFELIVPCGIREGTVTSMERELGRRVVLGKVEDALEHAFAEVFEAGVTPSTLPVTETVCVAAIDGHGRALALRRRPARGGFWQEITGRIEPGETPEQAARRELREETGLDAQVASLDYVHSFGASDAEPPRLFREHGFVARVTGEQIRLSDEHDAFEWLGFREAIERVPFPGLKRVYRLAELMLAASG